MSQQHLVEDIRSTLIADAELFALVGQRIYPDQAPQSAAYPYLIYQEVSLVGSYAIDGTDGTRLTRIQLDIYSPVKAVTRTALEALLRLLDAKKQTLANRTEILSAQLSGSSASFDTAEKIYRNQIDLTFRHRI